MFWLLVEQRWTDVLDVCFPVQMLFLKINASFKMHLKRQLARLGVVNDGGPQNG